jgi:hypothetical protein
MRSIIIRALVAVAVTIAAIATAAPAAADGAVTYTPPVDAPISDPFRAPATPYGSGHRGTEYATAAGTEVHAVADGSVTFAGVVAAKTWVTIRHADGVRTTYGPLQAITVRSGATVHAGDVVGVTAGPLLLTARVDEQYVDPASLFNGPRRVYLVPEPLDLGRPLSPFSPSWTDRAFDAVSSAVQWELDRFQSAPELAMDLTAVPVLIDTLQAVAGWNEQRHDCTPLLAPPPPPGARRLAILVAGLGSSSSNAAVADVDTAALGYAPSDVARFSYAGGRVPSPAAGPAFAAVPVHEYGPRDTVGDIDEAAQRLAAVLRAVVHDTPDGVPVDVIAHSQGGLVTRAALARLAVTDPDVVARLGVVATLATPHQGAELAGLVQATESNIAARPVLDTVDRLAGMDVHPDDVAVRQLVPGSDFLRRLAQSPLPAGPSYVSIAARGDVVVPSPQAHLTGAANVVVSVDGLHAHDGLPGSAAATVALARAIGGQAPTCESLSGAVIDAAEGSLILHFERVASLIQGG